MITNDASIVGFKHKIIEEMARLAWKGEVTAEDKEELVYKIIPGPLAQYRCCIYKEREIVRRRIRLAEGLNSTPHSTTSEDMMIEVLSPACEECPISSYVVTDNCRSCMGKPCQKACAFGAISIGDERSRINPNMCKECGKCAAACPYSAIVHLERPCKKACPVGAITYDEYGYCKIDEDKCIQCGHCIHSCPFAAIGSKTFLVDIIKEIKAGKEVIAMCAPATEGQFGADIGMAAIRKALVGIGFYDMVEVGLGGDMTAAYEAKEWIEARKEGRKMTTSCCPAFVSLLHHHFPEQFRENKSTTVSPMVAVSRYLKSQDPDCITVFIGPCISKKSETMNKDIKDNADYAMTYGEMVALLDSRKIEITPVEEDYQEASVYGKGFAGTGGVANAVLEAMQEMGEDTSNLSVLRCSGGDECRKGMLLLKNGRLKEDFIEGMICPGGCVGGPSKHQAEPIVERSRRGLLAAADKRGILENLKKYPMDQFSMYRDGHMEESSL
jgi:ferredoxin hydrogenase large subunit